MSSLIGQTPANQEEFNIKVDIYLGDIPQGPYLDQSSIFVVQEDTDMSDDDLGSEIEYLLIKNSSSSSDVIKVVMEDEDSQGNLDSSIESIIPNDQNLGPYRDYLDQLQEKYQEYKQANSGQLHLTTDTDAVNPPFQDKYFSFAEQVLLQNQVDLQL